MAYRTVDAISAAQQRASSLVTASGQIPLHASEDGGRLMSEVAAVVRARSARPLAIYVSVPYCAYKCHFCDWVADVPVGLLRSGSAERHEYANAVCRQIRHYGPQLTAMGYAPEYMYWGGGTPTRLDVSDMLQIDAALKESFDLSALKQWTVESTPNDLTLEKVNALIKLGVTRISLGVQSLNPEQLRKSGRGHSPAQAEAAVQMLKDSEMRWLNIDVMTGFPEEDPEWVDRSLERLVELGVPHFSVYPFRTSAKTVVEKQIRAGRLVPNDLEHQLKAFERAGSILQSYGFERGQHHGSWRTDEKHEDKDGNYKYKLMGDKIGFGSGADSMIGHRLVGNPNGRLRQFIEDPLGFTHVQKFSLSFPHMFTNCVGAPLMAFTEGLVFERFETLTGTSFHELRKTPWGLEMFAYIQFCGGIFIETPDAIRLDPCCVDRVVIAHQANITENMRPHADAAPVTT
jgi:coproporphyrinogen III oxidase-like Fe-S oxidoreductase